MKVPESNRTNAPNLANVSALRNRGAEQTVKGTPGGGTAADDQVRVSSLSSLLSKLNSQSESHASRLMELSSVVSAGRYHVDANVVIQKLIQEHLRSAA